MTNVTNESLSSKNTCIGLNIFLPLTSFHIEKDTRCFVRVNRLRHHFLCVIFACMFLLLLLCVYVCKLIKKLLRDDSNPVTSKLQESLTYLDL